MNITRSRPLFAATSAKVNSRPKRPVYFVSNRILGITGLLLAFHASVVAADETATKIEQPLYVKVAPVHEVPTFSITRDPDQGYRSFARPCFETYVPQQKYFEQFAAAGTQLFCFNANAAACDYGHSTPVWVDAETWDYTQLDDRVQRVLNAQPNAMIMPRVNLGTPRWWLEEHPEECELLADGSTRYRSPNRNPTLPQDRAFPALASRQWRQDIGQALRNLLTHIQSSDYADHIFGYILTGLDTEEWYHWSSGSNQLAGYSPHTRQAFQTWLREKYGGVAQLRRAWQRDQIDFDDVEVPTRSERFDLGRATFRDPAKKMNVIDFYVFYNEIIPDTIDYFARITKEVTGGRKVVGAFYGFMYEFRGDPEYGHNALGKFSRSPFIDFIYVTASYGNRDFARGGDYARSPAYSVRLHDKLWYHDNDVVSFLADKMWANQPQDQGNLNDVKTWKANLGYTATAQDSIAMYRRSFGFALCNGAYQSFFDLHGGYYDDPQLMAEVARLSAAADYVKRYNRSSNAEILVLADEDSCAYATFRSDLLEETLLQTQWQLIKLGAPVDHALLSDLGRLDTDRYKLIVFLNCYHIDAATRATISRQLKHGGKHLLWCYAPGYFGDFDAEASAASVHELTGLRIRPGDDPAAIAPRIEFASASSPLAKKMREVSARHVGPQASCCRLFHVDDERAVTLGTLPGSGEVTMAAKSMDGWTSLYSITAHLPAAVYRELAREAGVHIFNEQDDTFYANTTFVTLHANGAGPRTITFPWACNVEDVMTREIVAANQTSYTYDFRNGETLILKWRTRL